ncbi:MAG: DUF2497 domain-containing protein [Reyranellaceae bacterium]
MSDPKSPGNDPSMDDILASIRKIISDDEARAQMTNQKASGPQAPGHAARLSVVPPPEPLRPEPKPRAGGHDDVLLLTEDLMEDPTAPMRPIDGAPTPSPQPRSEPARPIEASRSEEVRVSEITPMPTQAASAPPAAVAPDRPLIDGSAAGAAADAFARLSLAVQESVAPPTATDPGMLVGGTPQTIEDLVKEMLRPMLKDWLDRNLPGVVERYVEREIVRLTRR